MNASINALRILNEVNRTDVRIYGFGFTYNIFLFIIGFIQIPIYKGAEGGLLLTPPYEHYYGTDGFGDVFTKLPSNMDIIQKEHAAFSLVNIVNNNIG